MERIKNHAVIMVQVLLYLLTPLFDYGLQIEYCFSRSLVIRRCKLDGLCRGFQGIQGESRIHAMQSFRLMCSPWTQVNTSSYVQLMNYSGCGNTVSCPSSPCVFHILSSNATQGHG